MTTLNTPAIGDIVLDPNEKFNDLDGKDKFDQLLCDGSEVLESEHPEYYELASFLVDMESEYAERIVLASQVVIAQTQYYNYGNAMLPTSMNWQQTEEPDYATRYGNTSQDLDRFKHSEGGTIEERVIEAISEFDVTDEMKGSGVMLTSSWAYGSGDTMYIYLTLSGGGTPVRFFRYSRTGWNGSVLLQTSSSGSSWTTLISLTDSDVTNCLLKVVDGVAYGYITTTEATVEVSEVWDTATINIPKHAWNTSDPRALMVSVSPSITSTKVRPTITTPEGQEAYRVVADLTEGEL